MEFKEIKLVATRRRARVFIRYMAIWSRGMIKLLERTRGKNADVWLKHIRELRDIADTSGIKHFKDGVPTPKK